MWHRSLISLPDFLARRRCRGRRAQQARRTLSFEHCEPRLALSGATGAAADMSALSTTVHNEGGFVVVADLSTLVPGTYSLPSGETDSFGFFCGGNLNGNVIIAWRDSATATLHYLDLSEAIQNAGEGMGVAIEELCHEQLLRPEGDLFPIWIAPPPGSQPPDGGMVAIPPFSGENLAAPALGSGQSQFAERAQDNHPAGDPSLWPAPRAESEVEGLRGRAVVLEVALRSETPVGRAASRAIVNPSVATVEPSQLSVAFEPSGAAQPDHVSDSAAVDTVYASSGHSEQHNPEVRLVAVVRPVASVANGDTSAADHAEWATVNQHATLDTQRDERTTDGHTLASSESSIVARDEALAEELTETLEGSAAAIFNPVRNRPVFAVAAASVLMAARSLYGSQRPAGPLLADDRPRRRHSVNG